jgi:oligopeptide transport system ATP-binding protein
VPPLEVTDNGSQASCIRWEEIAADPVGTRTRARN